MTQMNTEAFSAADAKLHAMRMQRRKRLFVALAATVAVGAVGYGVYSYAYLSRFVSTDNAYTSAETAQVTPAVAGIVRAYVAAQETGIRLIVGARLDFDDAPSVLCFPRDRPAYARLTTVLQRTRARKLETMILVSAADSAMRSLRSAPKRDRRAFAIQVLLKKRPD